MYYSIECQSTTQMPVDKMCNTTKRVFRRLDYKPVMYRTTKIDHSTKTSPSEYIGYTEIAQWHQYITGENITHYLTTKYRLTNNMLGHLVIQFTIPHASQIKLESFFAKWEEKPQMWLEDFT